MTTTEIATITEIDGHMTPRDAKALDKKIRATNDRMMRNLDHAADNYQTLLDLLDQARKGEIYKALGIKTWNLWFKDTVRLTYNDRDERKALTQIMSTNGMSQRTIRDILGVGVGTVSRDLSGVPCGTPEGKVTGTDGKQQSARKKLAAVPDPEQPLDVEVVEVSDEPAPKLPPLTEVFRDEVDTLRNCVQAFKDIVDDDRFEQSRNRIAKLKAFTLFHAAINDLDVLETAINE
jgi:Trp operon repressor